MVGWMLSRLMRWGGPGVEPHGLQYILTIDQTTNTGVPRGSQWLGHVAPNHWPKTTMCRHRIHPMSANHNLPRHHRYSHTDLPHQPVRTVQSASIFLFVWLYEQIAISLAPDVRLRWNELCWVCNDEAYALVRFEVIPSTLNFWAKFDPLITLGCPSSIREE